MTNDNTIKPNKCPFCGCEKLKVGTKVTDRKYYAGEDTITASVRCNRCHARGPTVSYTHSYKGQNLVAKKEAEKLAIETWNDLKGLK